MTDPDPFDRYYAAGLTDEEAQGVADLVVALGAADPFATHLAVQAVALRRVVAVVDRFVDAATARPRLHLGPVPTGFEKTGAEGARWAVMPVGQLLALLEQGEEEAIGLTDANLRVRAYLVRATPRANELLAQILGHGEAGR